MFQGRLAAAAAQADNGLIIARLLPMSGNACDQVSDAEFAPACSHGLPAPAAAINGVPTPATVNTRGEARTGPAFLKDSSNLK